MILPRCLVLLLGLLAATTLSGQVVAPVGPPPPPAAFPAAIFADERAARLAERYKTMLAANPAEGLALDRLWKAYANAGATSRLIEEYQHAAGPPTADAATVLLYGHLLKKAGRLDEAAAVYQRAAVIIPGSPLPTLASAELALVRSQPADAARQFESALGQLSADDHRRADLLLKTGDAWQAAGQPLKAAGDWELTVAMNPGDLAMHRRLAENYEKNNLSERAIGHFEYIEAHADPAGRASALRELGRLHEARGEFDAARDALERGLALTSRDNWFYGDLQKRLILLYQRAGRIPELQARWQKAVEQAPRDLGGYLRLESLAEAQGDTAVELTWLEKIVALSPRDHDSTLKLARLVADNGERESAAALYDKLLQSQPGNLELILARADLDVQMGRPDAAAARVEARLAQNPTDDSIATAALEFFLGRHLDLASEKFLRAQVSRQPAAAEPSLALAKFLFAQRRLDEAHHVLDELAAQPGTSPERGSRWMAVAGLYKEQNLPREALHCWQEAASSQPGATAPLLAASEWLLAHGDARGAADPLNRALEATPPGPERVEIEHKLFQVIQAAGSHAGGERLGDGSGWARVTSAGPGLSGPVVVTLGKPRPDGDAVIADAPADEPLGQYLENLRSVTHDQPTADHYLRLARWQLWAGATDAAVSSSEKAIGLDPANLPARELLVAIATDMRRQDAAEERLREIMTLDPSRKGACLRRIAGLKTEGNDLDGALEIYQELQNAAPGSVDALSDLALAEQRADRWYDALAHWEHAYALPGLTPAQRADLRRPLLAAYEKLDQFPRAAEILQAAVDAQTDLPARGDMFRELAAFCRKHDLGDWLLNGYRTRLAAQPNDYSTLIAMAELSRGTGQDREAYRLLERAYYSSPDPAGTLRTLADAAGALGENEEAIAHQRRLVALPGQATAENLEKIADLQSDNLDADAAARTWEQIVAKFPRDPNSLERSAQFFESDGNIGCARELFQRVIALDTTDPRRLYHLARLSLEAGATAEARALLEQLLDRTDPEKPGDPFLPPPELDFSPGAVSGLIAGIASHRAHALGLLAAAAPAEPDDQHLRLDAVRELSRLVLATGSDGDRQKWLDRWRGAAAAGQRNEPLTAYFYAGQHAATMDLVTGWLKASPDDERIRNTFLTTGLRLAEYRLVAQWVWYDADLAHKAERSQWLLGTLEQYLNGGGKPGPNIVAELFPPEMKMRETLWEAASTAFAERHWYAQAAELGTRVLALVPDNRAEYAVKIAQWDLYVGNTEPARAVLRDAIETDSGRDFDAGENAVFAALRAYYLLLPEGERSAFVENYPHRMHDRGELVHATLSAMLLHGLAGSERAAERDLDDLLAMGMPSVATGGGTPDARKWNYVRNAGVQLRAWNLDALAAYYWRHALRDVSAFDRQDGDATNAQADIRGRLLLVDLAMAADPQQARERVEAYLRAGPGWDVVALEAGQLLAASQWGAAARLYEALCRARPNDAEHWRNLFVAYDSAGDHAALERTLTSLLARRAPLPVGLNRLDLVTRLANLRETMGDGMGACRLLEHARMEMPGVQPLLIQLAQAEERADRWDEAARAWTEAMPLDPSGGARLSLAAVDEKLGQADQAIALLNGGFRSMPEATRITATVRLARLYVNAHRIDDARSVGNRVMQEGPATALPAVAAVLANGGERPFARELLEAGVRRTHDPLLRYQEQQALTAQDATTGEDAAVFTREMHRLEDFTRADAGLRNSFLIERYQLARQRGADAWLENELKREWDDSKGDLSAGEKLASLYVETNRDNDLRVLIEAIDHHPDLPEQTLHSLATRLVQTRHGAMALPMLERLRRRFPQNDWYAQDQVRALWQAGRHDEANAALETFEHLSVFRDDLVGQAGTLMLELGDKAQARQKFEAVMRRDPLAIHYPQVAVQLARLAMENDELAPAYRWLRAACRNPTFMSLAPLVEYLDAAGRLEIGRPDHTPPGSEFPLTFVRRAQLLAAIYGHLTTAKRVTDARGCIEEHSELLAGAPGLVSTVRGNAAPTDLPALAALVEGVISQTDPPVPQLGRELAALYIQWAEQDGASSDGALGHLARAYELEPDDFGIAQRLVAACLVQKKEERAASVLAAFIGPDALPAERTRAQEMLSKLPARIIPSGNEG